MMFVLCLPGLQNTLWSYIFSTLPLSKESILPSMLLLLWTASLPLLHWFCTTASAAPRLLLHWVLGLQSSTLLPDHQHCHLVSKHQHWSSSTNTATCPLSITTAPGPRVSSLLSQISKCLLCFQIFKCHHCFRCIVLAIVFPIESIRPQKFQPTFLYTRESHHITPDVLSF